MPKNIPTRGRPARARSVAGYRDRARSATPLSVVRSDRDRRAHLQAVPTPPASFTDGLANTPRLRVVTELSADALRLAPMFIRPGGEDAIVHPDYTGGDAA